MILLLEKPILKPFLKPFRHNFIFFTLIYVNVNTLVEDSKSDKCKFTFIYIYECEKN